MVPNSEEATRAGPGASNHSIIDLTLSSPNIGLNRSNCRGGCNRLGSRGHSVEGPRKPASKKRGPAKRPQGGTSGAGIPQGREGEIGRQ